MIVVNHVIPRINVTVSPPLLTFAVLGLTGVDRYDRSGMSVKIHLLVTDVVRSQGYPA